MQPQKKSTLWLIVLIVVFLLLIGAIYVGAIGMRQGIYGTKLN